MLAHIIPTSSISSILVLTPAEMIKLAVEPLRVIHTIIQGTGLQPLALTTPQQTSLAHFEPRLEFKRCTPLPRGVYA
jgi:hypothetical protein